MFCYFDQNFVEKKNPLWKWFFKFWSRDFIRKMKIRILGAILKR